MSTATAAPTRFLVSRQDGFRDTRFEPCADATRALAEGEARLAIRAFALTANNISYAASGDKLGYWRFFPAPEGWGCIPTWGFADVLESRAEGLAVGERLYGYLPMASHLVITPTRANPASVTDGAAHRRELPPVYNQLRRCASDPAYRREREGVQALLRPLFTTAFLIDDFFAGTPTPFLGAAQILLSSASSKTAYATAFCLARRTTRPRLVGLTSPAHLEFTRGLGLYDEVVAYDALAARAGDVPTVYIDYSGDAAVRRAVHERFGDALRHDCAVGATHWRDAGSAQGLPGPRPEFFFAPTHAAHRAGPPPEGWGPAGFDQRLTEAWEAFLRPVAESPTPWLKVIPGQGEEAVAEIYRRLLDGRIPAIDGHVLAL